MDIPIPNFTLDSKSESGATTGDKILYGTKIPLSTNKILMIGGIISVLLLIYKKA